MHTVRLFVVSVILLATLFSSPVDADEPRPTTALNPPDPAAALSPEERRLASAKERRFQERWRKQQEWLAKRGNGGVTIYADSNPGGSWPQYFELVVTPRQQQYWNYCAPAATQATEAWTKGTYTAQTTIASTEGTSGAGTYVYMARYGLNIYAQKPAGFFYEEFQPGTSGQWWGRLQEDIAGYAMPQIVTVAPHDTNAAAWLPSWPNAITTGHYIVLNAYYGYNSSDAGAWVKYVDSSAGFSGGTGTYTTMPGIMWYVIGKANENHAAPWIIW